MTTVVDFRRLFGALSLTSAYLLRPFSVQWAQYLIFKMTVYNHIYCKHVYEFPG
jgi:hypothetical protein